MAKQTRSQTKLKNLRNDLNRHLHEQHGFKLAIKQAKRDVKKYTEELDSHDYLKELNDKAKKIKIDIEELQDVEKNHTDKVAEQRDNFGLFLLNPLLHLLNKNKSSVIEAWESVAAHSVLERKRCLCDKPLDAESIGVLEAKMSDKTRTQYRLHEIVSKISSTHDLDAKMNDLTNALQRLQQTQERKEHLQDDLNSIDKEIDNIIDREFDYEYTIKNLREAQGNIETWKWQLDKCEANLVKSREKIKRFEREIESNASSTNLTNIKKRLEVTEKLNRAVDLSIEDFYKKRRPKLEKMISDVFIRLTNNPQLYRRLEVEDDFSIRIVKIDGVFPTSIYSPSAGMSQIVATAIISGLSNFATRDAPIIIDTPLGRLDPVHKENVIRHYSQMGKQVIILYHQREMDDHDIQIINNNIASEWKIEATTNEPGVSRVLQVRSNV